MSKSILDFDAVGDGRTDCTNALKQAAHYDGAVYFPEGTYIITSQIDTGEYLNWHGEGARSVIKLLPLRFEGRKRDDRGRIVYSTRMLNMKDGKHFEIHDLTIDANKEAYMETLLPEEDVDTTISSTTRRNDHIVCVEVSGAEKIIIDGCTLKNGIIEGAYIDRCADICITRSTFTGNGVGKGEDASGLQIHGGFRKSPAIRVSDCVFSKNGFNGLLLNDVYGALVNNISCTENGFEGVALWNGTRRCVLSNIFSASNRSGICFRGDDHGWEADRPADGDDERCYCTENIVNGLITLNNENSGISWGCAQNIQINGWICNDTYAHELFYIAPDHDITCKITNSHINPKEEEILDRSDNRDAFQPVVYS